MIANILDTAKVFDLVEPDGAMKSVKVRNLSLKQKDEAFLYFEGVIKDRKRKEFLAMAGLMEGKERMKFLIEASGSNKVTQEEVITEAQTVGGVAYTLDQVAETKLNWVAIMADGSSDTLLRAYYWAMGVDLPELEPVTEAATTEAQAKEGPAGEGQVPLQSSNTAPAL